MGREIISSLLRCRKLLRVLALPLELVVRLSRKTARLVLNNAQLSVVQKVGNRLSFGEGLSVQNSGFIEIGDDFQGGNRLQLSTYSQGSIRIGNRCFIGDDCKIVSDNSSISIGHNCLIAEQVSIRASNHGTKCGELVNRQPNSCKDIVMGDDVWIGKGVTILAGSIIPDGVVIGANSVVTSSASYKFDKNTIYAGNPAKLLRNR
jgi:acetyltransferase-like isoleucine patch superfamily enzyme